MVMYEEGIHQKYNLEILESHQFAHVAPTMGREGILHSDKKKLNEPRECLFKGMLSKVLVEK